MPAMKLLVIRLLSVLASAVLAASASAETPAPADTAGGASFETVIKKLDEQNMKIDALSQQILKLEQQIGTMRPGVIIGEATPSPAASSSTAAASAAPDTGNAHVVTKGETLTSIAKTHKVGVGDLQKFNHIENDRALQIGQTIMIPTPAGASPAPSTSASPNE